MKRYRLQDTDSIVLEKLSRYFRLDIRELRYDQKIEMSYIFNRLAEMLSTTDAEVVVLEIDRLRILLGIRGKRRSLYHVFHWCQANHMRAFGDYDTSSRRPPMSHTPGDYY